MKQETIPVTIRMPADLHAWIKKQAEKERRSSHSFILRMIEKSMETEHAPG